MQDNQAPEELRERERRRNAAACAAKSLGIEEAYADLMAKFEAAKAALLLDSPNIGDVGCAGEARPPHTQP